MVAAFGRHETVFTVLGDAARKRGAKSLALQLMVSGVAASAILVSAPHWWSLAFLAGWSAAYSAWGLLVRLRERTSSTPLNAALTTIAALGTVLAIAGIVGLGMAIYLGDAAGAKNRCGKVTTSPRCEASANPPPASYRIVP
jgi:hypothetical protein